MRPPGAGKHTLSDQIREVIGSRGLSAYAIARDAQVDRRAVERWLKGEKDLNLATADAIAAALGLRLVEVARRPMRAGK